MTEHRQEDPMPRDSQPDRQPDPGNRPGPADPRRINTQDHRERKPK